MMMTNETKESKKMEKSASLRKSYAKKFHRLRITNNSDFFFSLFISLDREEIGFTKVDKSACKKLQLGYQSRIPHKNVLKQ